MASWNVFNIGWKYIQYSSLLVQFQYGLKSYTPLVQKVDVEERQRIKYDMPKSWKWKRNQSRYAGILSSTKISVDIWCKWSYIMYILFESEWITFPVNISIGISQTKGIFFSIKLRYRVSEIRCLGYSTQKWNEIKK